jgi:hypothetical protein
MFCLEAAAAAAVMGAPFMRVAPAGGVFGGGIGSGAWVRGHVDVDCQDMFDCAE